MRTLLRVLAVLVSLPATATTVSVSLPVTVTAIGSGPADASAIEQFVSVDVGLQTLLFVEYDPATLPAVVVDGLAVYADAITAFDLSGLGVTGTGSAASDNRIVVIAPTQGGSYGVDFISTWSGGSGLSVDGIELRGFGISLRANAISGSPGLGLPGSLDLSEFDLVDFNLTFFDPDPNTDYVPSIRGEVVVPLPAAGWLFAAALSGIAVLRRRG